MKGLFGALLVILRKNRRLFPVGLFLLAACSKPENLPHVAAFTVDPVKGDTLTVFLFNAKTSSGPELQNYHLYT
ncbi:MAG: hypothetical protein WC865_12000 [Bacteroidales bacterium]